MKSKISKLAICALTVFLTLSFTGCMGYRLGSMLPKDLQSVHVPTFVNKTTEPLIEVDTTAAVITELQKDGSLKVQDEATANAILEVTLTDYQLTALAYDKDRPTSANEYRIILTASIMLRRKATNEVVTENPRVQGEATFQVSGDLTSSKATALSTAAQDLAHDIVEKLVETW